MEGKLIGDDFDDNERKESSDVTAWERGRKWLKREEAHILHQHTKLREPETI